MRSQSLWLVLLLVAGLFLAIAARYYSYFVTQDFIIYANVICDTNVEACFVSDCIPGEDLGCDGLPYKKIEILANEAPKCILEHTCETFSCENYPSCVVTYCSADVIEDGEACLDPNDQVEAGSE